MTSEYNSLILYKPEQKLFDYHPRYTSTQRKEVFFITKRLSKSLDKFRGYSKAILFVKYAYFRSHNKIYENFSAHDFKKACSVIGLRQKPDSLMDKRTSMKIESEILKIFGFKRLTSRNEDVFIFFIHSMMKKRKSNKDIFDFLVEEFARRKVAVPDYPTIEALMHKAFKLFDPYEQVSKMKMTKVHKSVIAEILDQKIEASEKNKPNLTYKSSKLNQIRQSQKLKDIKVSLANYRDLKLYTMSQKALFSTGNT